MGADGTVKPVPNHRVKSNPLPVWLESKGLPTLCLICVQHWAMSTKHLVLAHIIILSGHRRPWLSKCWHFLLNEVCNFGRLNVKGQQTISCYWLVQEKRCYYIILILPLTWESRKCKLICIDFMPCETQESYREESKSDSVNNRSQFSKLVIISLGSCFIPLWYLLTN